MLKKLRKRRFIPSKSLPRRAFKQQQHDSTKSPLMTSSSSLELLFSGLPVECPPTGRICQEVPSFSWENLEITPLKLSWRRWYRGTLRLEQSPCASRGLRHFCDSVLAQPGREGSRPADCNQGTAEIGFQERAQARRARLKVPACHQAPRRRARLLSYA